MSFSAVVISFCPDLEALGVLRHVPASQTPAVCLLTWMARSTSPPISETPTLFACMQRMQAILGSVWPVVFQCAFCPPAWRAR